MLNKGEQWGRKFLDGMRDIHSIVVDAAMYSNDDLKRHKKRVICESVFCDTLYAADTIYITTVNS